MKAHNIRIDWYTQESPGVGAQEKEKELKNMVRRDEEGAGKIQGQEV